MPFVFPVEPPPPPATIILEYKEVLRRISEAPPPELRPQAEAFASPPPLNPPLTVEPFVVYAAPCPPVYKYNIVFVDKINVPAEYPPFPAALLLVLYPPDAPQHSSK